MQYAGFLYQGYGYSNQGCHKFFTTGLSEKPKNPEPEEDDLIKASFAISAFEEMLLSGEIREAATMASYGLVKLKELL
jgi:ADP-ribose pyrophosphatase